MDRADDIAAVRHRRLRDSARDAEVGHLRVAVSHHEDVVRLDVAVHEIVRMRVRERFRDLAGHAQGLADREVPLLADIVLEGAARHVFHDDVVVAICHADIVDVDDIRMREACCRLGLTLEFIDEFLVLLELFMQDLDGHRPIEKAILCLVDIGHAASADQLFEFIALIQDTLYHIRSPYDSSIPSRLFQYLTI